MSKARAACIAWLLAAPALLLAVDRADDANNTKVAESATETADAELLEYLGSVDAEGQEWMDYLAHTDITKVKQPRGATEGEE